MNLWDIHSAQFSSDFSNDCRFPDGRIIKEMAPPKAGFSEKLQQNRRTHCQPPVPYFGVYEIFPTKSHAIRRSHVQAMWIFDWEQCKVKRAILAARVSNMSCLQIKTWFISRFLSPISLQKAPVSWHHFNGIQCEQLKDVDSEAWTDLLPKVSLLCPQCASGSVTSYMSVSSVEEWHDHLWEFCANTAVATAQCPFLSHPSAACCPGGHHSHCCDAVRGLSLPLGAENRSSSGQN